MAITLFQSAGTAFDGGSTFTSFAYPSNNVAGNFLLVELYDQDASGTLSDSQGNTWNQLAPANGNITFWYAMNCKAGANTVTLSGPDQEPLRINVYEFTGVAHTSAFDKTASQGFDLSGHFTPTGPITPTANGELIFCVQDGVSSNASALTITPGSGWTAGQTFASASTGTSSTDAWFQQTTAAAISNSNWTFSANLMWTPFNGGVILSFKAAPAPPGGTVDPGGLLGMMF